MHKLQLIETLAKKTNLGKKTVEDFLVAFEKTVIENLQKGEEVTLTGFGTFLAKKRHARLAANPLNPKEKIQVPEVIVPKFRAGKTLKDALKKKP